MGRVEGKVALITGGARGQGRSHALALAREGADVVVCDVAQQLPTAPYPLATEEDLAETAQVVEDLDRRCLAIQADVRDGDQMRGVVERAIREFGHVDILLANAGIESFGKTWELTNEQWNEMIAVNLTGVWHTCKVAIPHMLEAGNRESVIISSLAGFKGLGNVAAYTATKHGIVWG